MSSQDFHACPERSIKNECATHLTVTNINVISHSLILSFFLSFFRFCFFFHFHANTPTLLQAGESNKNGVKVKKEKKKEFRS
jgi:hypothetical protein